ncbi:MAG: ABC transporter ATP-binding protein [Methylobacteriaceae bacterium]|nr:ABC transporter ATP-binding protein [Methylobacteriaceae bacterium]
MNRDATDAGRAAVELIGVRKSFGQHVVIADFSLAVRAGEFIVLLGQSGSGKSTILRLIAGIEAPDDGEILIDDKLINYEWPRDRNVAMVFQNYALYPHLTVAKNIAFPLKSRHGRSLTSQEVRARVLAAAQLVDLESQLAKLPGQLSGGQRQRVALARAIVRDPAAFLMDEPLSNLDALLRHEMRRSLLDLHRRLGKVTIYVTHDQFEAMTMADRIVVLKDGAIEQIGTPREIYETPRNRFVAGFVGTPSMNFLDGSIAADGTIEIAGGPSLRTGLPGLVPEKTDVSIGLRPTDLALDPGGAGTIAIEGRVVRSEYAGADVYWDCSVGPPQALRVRVGTYARPGPEGRVTIHVPTRQLHLFRGSGERLDVPSVIAAASG